MQSERFPAARGRVLIIDDDEVIAVTLVQHLVRRGFPADVALDFASAERLLEESVYHVVLIDPYMTGQPRRDIVQLVKRFRALAPAAQILLVTAYASVPLSDELRAIGRVTVVTKPVPVMHLTEIVEGSIDAQQREN